MRRSPNRVTGGKWPVAALAAILAAVAAALVVEGVEAGPGPARSCRIPDGRIVTLTTYARITAAKEEGLWRWYGCLHSRGRQVYLGENEGGTGERLTRPRVAGPFVAFQIDARSIGSEPPTPVLMDLRSGNTQEMAPRGVPTDMLVTSRGDLIIRESPLPERAGLVVHLTIRGTQRVLDRGAIARGSLALSRNERLLYWQRDGIARMAHLR